MTDYCNILKHSEFDVKGWSLITKNSLIKAESAFGCESTKICLYKDKDVKTFFSA